MNKALPIIAIIALVICSAFIMNVPDPHVDDHALCVSCHSEWSPGLFESYKADMRVHIPTLSIVVVNEVKGVMCNVSGIDVKGWVLCGNLFTPQDINFESVRG